MRIDQLLVQRGLASTRSQAQRLIASGVEWLGADVWHRVAKNGDLVADDAPVRLLDAAEARYVSRGGLKLEGALKQLELSVQDFACLDVGQSTGGFTDCLLQHGARLVCGVDVGTGQLHPQLRQDARVTALEGCNARTLSASDLISVLARRTGDRGQFGTEITFDLIVVDVSFISQTLVLPALVPLLKEGGTLLSLVKPQFELQPGQVGKGGIIKDASLYPLVENRLRVACAEQGLQVRAWLDSPISGGDGNREFFICARKPGILETPENDSYQS